MKKCTVAILFLGETLQPRWRRAGPTTAAADFHQGSMPPRHGTLLFCLSSSSLMAYLLYSRPRHCCLPRASPAAHLLAPPWPSHHGASRASPAAQRRLPNPCHGTAAPAAPIQPPPPLAPLLHLSDALAMQPFPNKKNTHRLDCSRDGTLRSGTRGCRAWRGGVGILRQRRKTG